eukprot:6475544-Amphidinium_carterae.2
MSCIVHQVLTEVRQMTLESSMELADVLVLLDGAGKKLVWLYAQFIHEVASAMQCRLMRDVRTASAPEDRGVHAKHACGVASRS